MKLQFMAGILFIIILSKEIVIKPDTDSLLVVFVVSNVSLVN